MDYFGRYIAKWQAQRKRETTLEDGRMEIWRKMLITSQTEYPPPKQKGYEYDIISGVICLKLRIAKNVLANCDTTSECTIV